MKIVEPNVEYWEYTDPIDHIARVAHTCYMSTDKGHDANEKFYNNLIAQGHLSPLRHITFYYRIPWDATDDEDVWYAVEILKGSSFVDWEDNAMAMYFAVNGQTRFENAADFDCLDQYKVPVDFMQKRHPEIVRYTFCLTTQISTSRELIRHPLMSVMEMSTRYIKFGGKVEPSIVRPYWVSAEDAALWNSEPFYYKGELSESAYKYFIACKESFDRYDKLLNREHMAAEDARGVLPLDTMTKLIYTGSVRNFRHVIDLRYNETTGKAHPNAKLIIGMVKEKLEEITGLQF